MIILILLLSFVTSCAEWDNDGVDFRNYLRDRFPYSELKKIDLNGWYSYQVNDTIKNKIWVCTSLRSKNSVKCVCVSDNNKKQQ